MNKINLLLVLVILTSSITGYAEEVDNRANAFTQYLKLCMNSINDFEALRTQLTGKKLPKFPPEQAALFLGGRQGDAWPIPYQGKVGNFVLVLPANKSLCAIHARRIDQAEVERQFIRLVSNVSPPVVSELKNEERNHDSTNGMMHTVSYTWSAPQSSKKILFTLTTASSENANIQALGSVAAIIE